MIPGLRHHHNTSVDSHDDDHSWNERRWKLSKVAVTYIQEDEDGSMVRSKKGRAAEKTGVTGNNVQWHFVPPAGERQWVGKLPSVPDLLEIEREPGAVRSDGDWAHACCTVPKYGGQVCGHNLGAVCACIVLVVILGLVVAIILMAGVDD